MLYIPLSLAHLRLLESCQRDPYTPKKTSKPPLNLVITSIGLSTYLRVLVQGQLYSTYLRVLVQVQLQREREKPRCYALCVVSRPLKSWRLGGKSSIVRLGAEQHRRPCADMETPSLCGEAPSGKQYHCIKMARELGVSLSGLAAFVVNQGVS